MFTFIGVELSCNDFNTEHCKSPTTRMFTINNFFTSIKIQQSVTQPVHTIALPFLLVKKSNPKAYIIITITVYYLARCLSRGLLCEAVSTLPEAPLGICDARLP